MLYLHVQQAVDCGCVGDEGSEENLHVGDGVRVSRAVEFELVHQETRHGHGDDGETDEEQTDQTQLGRPGTVDLEELRQGEDDQHHVGDDVENGEDEELQAAFAASAYDGLVSTGAREKKVEEKRASNLPGLGTTCQYNLKG